MDEIEILYKAILKAIKNGYKNEMLHSPVTKFDVSNIYEDFQDYHIIFSHEFAKAFWGEKMTDEDRELYGETCSLYFWRWQLYLTEIVLEENPYTYLEKFLEE